MTNVLRPDSYARNTLERYTGSVVDDFGSYVILVNFQRYVDAFAANPGVELKAGTWTAAHDRQRGISMINFGVGSPSAGIVVHCLSYLDQVKAVIMLGMCGGIDDQLEIGDLLIPTASVRDEGTSAHYLQPQVPAMPSFWINTLCEKLLIEKLGVKPKSGIMLTTDYRMWEFDQAFVEHIKRHRILAIDMEIATLFSVAYALNLPIGSIMLVSDMPLRQGGIKSKDTAAKVFKQYTDEHLKAGVMAIQAIAQHLEGASTTKLSHEW